MNAPATPVLPSPLCRDIVAKRLPSSRRYIRDEWHPFGWKVAFYQTVVMADGSRYRRYHSATGVDRANAIANAIG